MPTTTPRAPRRDAAANREGLLDAAVETLSADVDAPLEAIADAAGLSRRALYGHFATRDDLVAEVLARGARRVAGALAPVTADDPRTELALIAATLWDEVAEVRVLAHLAVRGPARGRVAGELAPLRTKLRRTLDRGIRSGAFRDTEPLGILAALVEGTALAVLDEATTAGLDRLRGRRLVVRATLGVAGLGRVEADEVLAATPASGGPK